MEDHVFGPNYGIYLKISTEDIKYWFFPVNRLNKCFNKPEAFCAIKLK